MLLRWSSRSNVVVDVEAGESCAPKTSDVRRVDDPPEPFPPFPGQGILASCLDQLLHIGGLSASIPDRKGRSSRAAGATHALQHVPPDSSAGRGGRGAPSTAARNHQAKA